ncbi:MAG: sirohydrochlorin chelatase [Cyanobacteria bacterium SID2]|nr:sirohydrochlorin chelatase [Cyanobacteria bacterium SID2]MBP0004767.1 sirohydrochlorin chelatase [Cyanobacteria bacterium SBC]
MEHSDKNSEKRALLLLGHGTRDRDGRQTFLDFAEAFQKHDSSRPVIPCFLELTEPSIQEGVDRCVEMGYTDLTALPVLLFAARHNKFDVTNELDRARSRHPQVQFHYGRHLGVAPKLLDLWRNRLEAIDAQSEIPREETLILFVGRGASDPDANGDVYKMARLLWEGSGYKGVEICFSGITHPRLDPGFDRVWTWQPKRVVVIPHFLFTGVLVKRIRDTATRQQEQHPDIPIQMVDEIGLDPILFDLIGEREREAIEGEVKMNCEMCKFRQAVSQNLLGNGNGHGHHHHHGHHHGHHDHDHPIEDPYAKAADYHDRAWQVP